METSTFDTGTIVILAAVLLVGGMAVRSWIGSQKAQSVPKGEKLVPLRDELRNANASLAQLTTIVQQQQTAIDRNTQTLEGVRQSIEDQAGAGKSALESVSGAVGAARSEAAARDEAMRKLIGDVHGVAAAASENAENALLTAGGLRRKLDEVGAQAENIPPLRNDIQQLQQSVTAIAGTMPKPDTEQPPAPGKDDQPKPAREGKTSTNGRRARKTARKTAGRQTRRGKETPLGEATPTATEPPETEAPASASDGAQNSGTPPETPPTASAKPDAGAMKPATPDGDSAPSSQTAAADAATGTDGKPAPAAPPAAGTATAEADKAADESADGAANAADNDTTTTGARVPETGDDAAGETAPAAGAAEQTEAAQ